MFTQECNHLKEPRKKLSAKNPIFERHNFLITRQAGTGKTYLLKDIYVDLAFAAKMC